MISQSAGRSSPRIVDRLRAAIAGLGLRTQAGVGSGAGGRLARRQMGAHGPPAHVFTLGCATPSMGKGRAVLGGYWSGISRDGYRSAQGLAAGYLERAQ